ncbi:MAG: helix-turn-helix transcriptional regulator [Clostridia bacterium]|nr:helix-turn-helix transcriptional regulator [Clostridia bacterium]
MHKIVPSSETRTFPSGKPWRIWENPFIAPQDSAPLHYGDTLELTILHNAVCDAYIGGKHYHINGEDAVFIVPPGVIHSFSYQAYQGSFTAVNISVKRLKPTFDIESFLALHNLSFLDLPVMIPEVDETEELFRSIWDSDSISDFLIVFMKLFQLIQKHIHAIRTDTASALRNNEEFLAIITWTRQNISKKINLDEIAKEFGYTKYYFCKKFKKMTGISYIQYVNSTRLHLAGGILKNGFSINEAADQCGFENISYFTQAFKKEFGVSPGKYAREMKAKK